MHPFRRFETVGATLLALAVLIASSPARAQPVSTAATAAKDPGAGVHLDRALKHFTAREYAAAALEFQRAYEKKPSGESLYAWAQSERLSGNCANAVPLYERYLTREPRGANAEVARINVARCKTQTSDTAAVANGKGAADAAMPPTTPQPDAWYRDVAGAMLVGASAAAFGAAIGFRVTADRTARSQAEAASYDVFEGRANAVKRWDSLATAGVITGTSLLITGAARYLWRALR